MQKKLKITYYRDRCRGLGMCAVIAPQSFAMKRKKAVLADGKLRKGTEEYSSVVLASSRETGKIVMSGVACPVNAISVRDMRTGKELVRTKIVTHGAKRVHARKVGRKDFVMDKKGYYLIRIDRRHHLIEVGLCRKKNTLDIIVVGESPMEVYYELVKRRLISRFEHAAYIGKETQKAYTALQLGIEYVQDSPLDFSKKIKKSH